MNARRVSSVSIIILSIFIGLFAASSFSVMATQPGKDNDDLLQAKKGRARLDSLLKELPQNRDVTDTNGIRLLIEISNEYSSLNPERGLKYADWALSLSRSFNFMPGEAMSLNCYGKNLLLLNYYKESIEYFDKAFIIAREINDKPAMLDISTNAGIASEKKTDFNKALEYYDKALAIAGELNDKNSILKLLLLKGRAFIDLSDYDKALKMHDMALIFAREINDSANMCISLRLIGSDYNNLSKNSKALEYFDKALDVAQKTANYKEIAENYCAIARVYFQTSDFSRSLGYYDRALKINEDIGNKYGIGNSLLGKGANYHSLSEYSEASDCYNSARGIFEELEEKRSLSFCLNNLGAIYMNLNDYPHALESYNNALKIARELASKPMISTDIGNISIVYLQMSDYPRAMEYCDSALKIAREINNKNLIQTWLGILGYIYQSLSDYDKAMKIYQEALAISQEISDKLAIANHLNNMGYIYQYTEKNPEALEKFNQSLKIMEDAGVKDVTTALGNIANIYNNMGDYSKALDYYERALKIDNDLCNERKASIQLVNIGSLLFAMSQDSTIKDSSARQENLVKASDYIERAVKSFGLRGELKSKMNSLLKLEGVYSALGFYDKALSAYKEAMTIHDTIFSAENRRKIAQLDAKRDLEVKSRENEILQQKNQIQSLDISKQNQALQILSSQRKVQDLELIKKNSQLALMQKDKDIKDLEIKKSKAEGDKKARDIALLTKENQYQSIIRNSLIGAFLFASVIALLIFFFLRRKSRDNKKLLELNEAIKSEQDKSESLLHNILPLPIASRLKEGEKHVSDYFEEASIVFIDIVDFSVFASGTTPVRLIEVLNNVYTEFDKIAEKYGLEKIKTIGDCYMAVSGVPVKDAANAMAAARFATESMDKMNGFDTGGGYRLWFRAGIDCGPVIAGVIGEKKFIYDLWGDAVNTASRMEESGLTGRIQCTDRFRSAYYRSALHDGQFSFRERGAIEIKGKGFMNTYFLEMEEAEEVKSQKKEIRNPK